jgi:UDP-N-acetyl-D-mannosaminuronate dehydrogenase
MGIDIWEVIEAARTKPFGFMPFYPGRALHSDRPCIGRRPAQRRLNEEPPQDAQR